MAAASGRRLRLLGDGALDRGERGLGAAGIEPDGLGVSHVGTAAALAAPPPPTRTRASRRPEAEPQSKVETSLWILAANVSEIAAKKESCREAGLGAVPGEPAASRALLRASRSRAAAQPRGRKSGASGQFGGR